LEPFALTVWPSILTSTPDGTAIGFFPILDMGLPFLLQQRN